MTVPSSTLCAVFQQTAATHPDRPALRTVDGSVELTWADYARRVRTVAVGLAGVGVQPGENVALMLVNRPEFHVVDTAVLHLGATPFSVYNTFAPEQITAVCANAAARVMVTERRFLPQVRAARPGTAIETVVVVDGAAQDAITLDSVEARADPTLDFDRRWRSVTPDDVLTIVYTSGTSGPPKGVEITHRAVLSLLRSFLEAIDNPNDEGDYTVSFLPAAHMAERVGLHYLQMLRGSTITSCPDMRQVIAAMSLVRPTYFGAVPRVWEKAKAGIEARVADQPRAWRWLFNNALNLAKRRVAFRQRGGTLDPLRTLLLAIADRIVFAGVRRRLGLDRCRIILVGAAPTHPEILMFFAAIGIDLNEAYGMTETSGFIIVNPPDAPRFGTVGRALPGVGLRLADDGELLVRGNILMRGYRGEPDKTAEAIDADGWLHTGDIAQIDPDGYVRIIDRKKELIINAAGKNMSPLNIEAALTTAAPLIGQAVAIGDGRPYNVALIVLDPDATATFARQHGITSGAPGQHQQVKSAVAAAVDAANTHLARVEQIKRFAILDNEWQPGSDELTPKGSLKRKTIATKYADVIEALYAQQAR